MFYMDGVQKVFVTSWKITFRGLTAQGKSPNQKSGSSWRDRNSLSITFILSINYIHLYILLKVTSNRANTRSMFRIFRFDIRKEFWRFFFLMSNEDFLTLRSYKTITMRYIIYFLFFLKIEFSLKCLNYFWSR